MDVDAARIRLGQLRTHRDWSARELARLAKVSPSWVSDFERGLMPNPQERTLEAVARALGWPDWRTLITSTDLDPPSQDGGPADGDGTGAITREEVERLLDERLAAARVPVTEVAEEDGQLVRVPILAEVSAGRGSGHQILGHISVDRKWARGRELYAVIARGDCMAPEINDGDTVIYEATRKVFHNEIAVFTELDADEDGGYQIKRIEWVGPNKVRLVPNDGERRIVDASRIRFEGRALKVERDL